MSFCVLAMIVNGLSYIALNKKKCLGSQTPYNRTRFITFFLLLSRFLTGPFDNVFLIICGYMDIQIGIFKDPRRNTLGSLKMAFFP